MNEVREGASVVSTNPLYAKLGLGWVQQVRGSQAKVELRPTVFATPPYDTHSKILDVSELQVVKSPIQRLIGRELDEPWKFELLQRAAHLLVCNQDGQLGNARTDLLPHQITIAHDVVSSPRLRFLIADEVGLGKTIEAGMVIYALQQRGAARRVLIVTPAGLTLQWQEEMKEKFNIEFVVYGEDISGLLAFDQNNRVIASIDTLKLDRALRKGARPGHKTVLLGARDWDLIIFDEAHKLAAKTWSASKTEKTLNFRLAEDLETRCRGLILMTATPHQGDESKFENLMGLLHEHVTFEEWASERESSVPYTQLILRNRKSKVCDADGNPLFKGMEIHPVRVSLLGTGERRFHKALEEYLREGYGYAEQDPGDKKRKAIGFVMTTFQKLAASSARAIKLALARRRSSLQGEAIRGNLSAKIEHDVRCEGEQEEQEAGAVTDEFTAAEVEMLDRLIGMPVPKDAKQDELSQVIDAISREDSKAKILIFTEYLATQEFLEELLAERYGEGRTVRIRGGMTLWEKTKSIDAFRENPRVRFLVSTEAGGEGINLQFAHVMINYDLPWNPFRLAQRYGRLYRYGQENVVQVFNFQNAGTIEEKVRHYLEVKTRRAAEKLSKMTGESSEEIEEGLLGLYDGLLNYEKIFRDGLAQGDLQPSKEEIDEGVKRAEVAYKLAYSSLFSKDVTPFNPERFAHDIKSPLALSDVEAFVGDFVRKHGRNFSGSPDGTWEFLLPQCLQSVSGLEKRYHDVTFDRRRAIRESKLDFLSLGNPLTDAAIAHCGTVGFGGTSCSRTIQNRTMTGIRGIHFNFLVKRTKRTSESEATVFDMVPVFVRHDGTVEPDAGGLALQAMGCKPCDGAWSAECDFETLEKTAREAVLAGYADEAIWDEDVTCLNVALTEFE